MTLDSSRPALLVRPDARVVARRAYANGRTELPVDLALDANESLAPAEALQDAFRRAAWTDVSAYPRADEVESRLASRHGVPPDRVILTAGADDALERALRCVGGPGRRVLLTTPTFAMLSRYASWTGAAVDEIPWWRGAWPVEEALRRATDETTAVAVVSPNNPTGSVVAAEDLLRLAGRLPRALILLDHAYAEFGDRDLTEVALGRPNVAVFRTFSKAWGGAGLRLGYALGDPRVIGWMRSVGQPFAVSGPSVAALAALLDEDPDPPRARIERIRRQRAALRRRLERLGCESLPSQGNFVLARPPDAPRLHRSLAALGIGVRRFEEPADLVPWLRITLPGEPAAFRRLEGALATSLRPEAVLREGADVPPDAGAVRRALARRGVRHAWMLCRTPEGLRAARTVDLLPVGAPTDGMDGRRLLAAGAAFLITDVRQEVGT
jgi:histidinol-phosphate aminotransferase